MSIALQATVQPKTFGWLAQWSNPDGNARIAFDGAVITLTLTLSLVRERALKCVLPTEVFEFISPFSFIAAYMIALWTKHLN
jgi:hypothetical protein